MQEEITNRAVTLIITGAKLTEQTLEKAIGQFLAAQKQPKVYRGKQSLKQLARQNAGLSSIEITEENIRAFMGVAKKYRIDFALKKDKLSEHPRYLVFFKARDGDALTAAFKEFCARSERAKDKPSIVQTLRRLRAQEATREAPRTRKKELEPR